MFLTLIRHASATHEGFYKDFDRPLTRKGIEKAKKNAFLMDEQKWMPDLIISSSAVRALQTAQIYADNSICKLGSGNITTSKLLYLPEPEDILGYVRAVKNNYRDVFLFSHNTGISWAAQYFCNDSSILLPTGAAVRIEFDTKSWQEIGFGAGKKTGLLT